MKVVLASNNAGKIREFNNLLSCQNWQVVPQAEFDVIDAKETGLTFVENALIKARHASHYTKLPALADDSGLVVDVLGGAPGIYSARFAGTHGDSKANNQKLLAELKNTPDEKRTAFFYCTLVFMTHENDPTPIICQGKWHGYILHEPTGTDGFGYDPIFYVPEYKKSAAELPLDVKNKISHRGIALQSLLNVLMEKR
jgi:XTP/dITP diphosphohydrolase